MAKDKDERHDASHDDDKDLDHDKGHRGGGGDHDASHDASKAQRRAPDAGVRSDTRFGVPDEEVMSDVHGRIIKVDIVGGETQVTIAAGRQQGVVQGMEGYIKKGDTFLSELYIENVGKRTCTSKVDATIDQVRQHLDDVVINPTSKPPKAEKQAKDFKTRVIGVSIVDGLTRIAMGGGRGWGVNAGDKGILVDDSGKTIGHFIIDESHAQTCFAKVAMIIEEVRRASSVIINPS